MFHHMSCVWQDFLLSKAARLDRALRSLPKADLKSLQACQVRKDGSAPEVRSYYRFDWLPRPGCFPQEGAQAPAQLILPRQTTGGNFNESGRRCRLGSVELPEGQWRHRRDDPEPDRCAWHQKHCCVHRQTDPTAHRSTSHGTRYGDLAGTTHVQHARDVCTCWNLSESTPHRLVSKPSPSKPDSHWQKTCVPRQSLGRM